MNALPHSRRTFKNIACHNIEMLKDIIIWKTHIEYGFLQDFARSYAVIKWLTSLGLTNHFDFQLRYFMLYKVKKSTKMFLLHSHSLRFAVKVGQSSQIAKVKR